MKDIEKLAIAIAIEKSLAEITDGKKRDSLRATINRQMLQAYELDHTSKKEIWVNGQPVGHIRVQTNAKKIDDTFERFEVISMDSLRAFDDVDFHEYTARWLERHISDIAHDYFFDTGEMPDGCDMVTYQTTPAEPKPTVYISVKPELVADALRDGLPAAIAGLITDGGK